MVLFHPRRDVWKAHFVLRGALIVGLTPTGMRTLEFGWPIGMPLCRALGNGLWEVRSSLPHGRIARVIFCVHDRHAVLLHGFIKKTQKTPKADLDLALRRKREVEQ